VILVLVFLMSAARSQDLTVHKTSFISNQRSITVERFDPASKGLHVAVLLVHGGGGAEGGWRSSGMLEALTQSGYSVFVPHYFEAAEWNRSRAEELFPIYIQTLKDTLVYIAEQPDIQKPKGIGLVGFSLGGYLVLGLAAECGHGPAMEIQAVVEMYGAMPDSAARQMTTMPPVLILHGAKDESVPVKNAYQLKDLLTKRSVPYQIKIYPEQGHGFNGDSLRDANQRAASFLGYYLQTLR
jgi:carboxymethylenebutenolidase